MGIVVDVKEYESVSKKTYEYVEAVFGNDGRFLGYVVQKDGKYGFANINYKETCECQFTQEEMEEYLMRILKEKEHKVASTKNSIIEKNQKQ